MRAPTLLLALTAWLPLASAFAAETILTLRTAEAKWEIDATGSLRGLTGGWPGRNYMASNQPAPVLSLRIDGRVVTPDQATWDAAQQRLQFRYKAAGASAVVRAVAKPTHVVLELVVVEPADRVELALWGPYPLNLGETIGEIVGVVRNRDFAVGLQALNAKTLGGSPANENDIDVEYGADDHGFYPGLPAELRQGQGFRGDTARAMPYGGLVQAYVRNRKQARVLPNWGHEKYHVLPYADGGVVGSRIALFAGASSQALPTIGAIEVAEGLPHPTLDGVWAKMSPAATASYLIVDFSEDTVDRAIEMTQRAGLKYLYHSSPFETWGHFQLKPKLFPRGWEGFRACVEKARRVGVQLGFHTLSNFITPNDAYVTPNPDARLAVVGGSDLSAAVTADAREIPVTAAEYFTRKSALNTVRIGDELVKFGGVSEQAPWRLLQCERGAWGTRAAAHTVGAPVNRLLDHDYKVFLADASLSLEIARQIAAFCNQTGARQLSFDGLEGNWSTGYGQYGRTLFTQAWYDALAPELQGQVINDASNPGHFNWHINTRMNWGEPWYAGFRESQTLYRFKNQVLFERNYMPHMLGWFALRADTSVEDAEWLLARAAGFDAGFTLATSLASTAQLAADPESADTSRQFGAAPAILATIRQWESARLAGAFPPDVKARLRDNAREFQLRAKGTGQWDLSEVQVVRFTHGTNGVARATYEFENPPGSTGVQWILRARSTVPLAGLTLALNGGAILDLQDKTVPAGGSLRYAGGTEVIVADAAWREVGRLPIARDVSHPAVGPAKLEVGAALAGSASLAIEVRRLGPPTALRIPSERAR